METSNKPICCRCGSMLDDPLPGRYWGGRYYCEICWNKIEQLSPDPEPDYEWRREYGV